MSEPGEGRAAPGVAAPVPLERLWAQQPQPTRRGPKPGLTVDQIVAAAIEVADSEGLAGLSMSRVASKLGFTTMSLYRYVSTKDELLLRAQDAAFGAPPATPAGAPWRTALEAWAAAELAAYRRHPWSLQIPVTGVPMMPSQLGWLDAALGILAATPLGPNDKTSSVLLVTSYVRGIAQLEHELRTGSHGPQFDADAAAGAYADAMQRLVPADRYGHVRSVVEQGGFDDEVRPSDTGLDHEFRFGLQRILDGIGLLVDARAVEG